MRYFSVLFSLFAVLAFSAQPYSWQVPGSVVSAVGDLTLKQESFVYKAVGAVKYIDFAAGSDLNSGDTAELAWKHHPWDAAATDNAKIFNGAATYVFKRGVIYRGILATGNIDNVILTSDPKWGAGEAVISGAEMVTGWKQGADQRFPMAAKVWYADLQFAPRRVWIRDAKGDTRRLNLARTPNWKPGKDDYMAEWYTWEQPDWKANKNKIRIGDINYHLGIDTKNLTGDPEMYKDAVIWSEYGPGASAPFATVAEKYLADKKAVAFAGPGYADSGTIITGNRYFMEDNAQFLDEAGEFWFDKKDDGTGRLYLRMPDDSNPNTANIEAARYNTLLETANFNNVTISGLTFSGGNNFWNLGALMKQDIESSAIRMIGSGENLIISNCKFANLTGGIWIKAGKDSDRVGEITICDNRFTDLDRYGINISDSIRFGKIDPPFSTIQDVNILRNSMTRIGLRGGRNCFGHAMVISYPECAEIAGNIIDSVGGAGIYVSGGKGSGEKRDRPLNRVLIHHNKVTDPVMVSNDFGGIETVQGGPFYLYENICKNPGGYINWAYSAVKETKTTNQLGWDSARQGYAYCFDYSFKNYVFNNLAIGNNNTVGNPLCNSAAFQERAGFQNSFFSNVAYKFAVGHRRQQPRAGRDLFISNIYDNLTDWAFLHADAKNIANATAYKFNEKKGANFKLELNAYSKNVITGTPRDFGAIEEDGTRYKTIADFNAALKRNDAMTQDAGVVSPASALTDADKGDYRPLPGGAADGVNTVIFVPWGLYACVGEYNFTPNPRNPAEILDDRWYMAPQMINRDDYWKSMTFPLNGVNVKSENYVAGKLENWTTGALQLNGIDQYLTLKNIAAEKNVDTVLKDTGKEPWGTGSAPKTAVVGQPFDFTLTLNDDVPKGYTLAVDVNCFKGPNYGGWLGIVGRVKTNGPGPYKFNYKPQSVDGLTVYSITIYVSPTGGWGDAVYRATIPVNKLDAPLALNPNIGDSNFLVETMLKTVKGANGLIIEKKDKTGYSLSVNQNGNVEFTIANAAGSNVITGKQIINDGNWHHVIAETDRKTGKMTLYVNGKIDIEETGKKITGNIDCATDLFVAGTPEGRNLAATLDFLRICRGNLADARTTIDELTAWQFNGPQFNGFMGLTAKK